ncbi:MAG: hypothetical protein WC223_11795 [Bacteroidales bacterium]|jgi:hypothetical protein
MQIKFKIKNIFNLSMRKELVISGITSTGSIQKGMNILIEDKKIKIIGIEIIDAKHVATIGLTIKYRNEHDKQQLEQLFENTKEITIE